MTSLDGTGPYYLARYEPKQFAELSMNTNYWNTNPTIPNIIIKVVSDVTGVQELINGIIDILPDVKEPEKVIAANNTGYINRNQYLRHGYGYIMFNNSTGPTSEKAVRKALLYGLNREAINKIYFKDLAATIEAPISQVYWTYDKDLEQRMIKYDYDPAKANELLNEAGWVTNQNGVREKDGQALVLDWVTVKDLPFVDVMTPILIDNYKQLGIEVRVQQLDFSSLIEKVYNEREGFSMFNMAVSESYIPSPYNVWHSRLNVRGGNNTGQYEDSEADEILDKMKRTTDPDEFKKHWQDFVLKINDDVPSIPLYVNILTDLYNRRITNFDTSSLYSWTSAIMEAEIVSVN